MKQFINQNEKALLVEVKRMIHWHEENNKPLERLQVTKKQYNALMKIAKRAESGPLFDDYGRVDITPQEMLDGIEVFYEPPKRKRYRRNDTKSLPL